MRSSIIILQQTYSHYFLKHKIRSRQNKCRCFYSWPIDFIYLSIEMMVSIPQNKSYIARNEPSSSWSLCIDTKLEMSFEFKFTPFIRRISKSYLDKCYRGAYFCGRWKKIGISKPTYMFAYSIVPTSCSTCWYSLFKHGFVLLKYTNLRFE